MDASTVDIIAQVIRVFGDESASAVAERIEKALAEAGRLREVTL